MEAKLRALMETLELIYRAGGPEFEELSAQIRACGTRVLGATAKLTDDEARLAVKLRLSADEARTAKLRVAQHERDAALVDACSRDEKKALTGMFGTDVAAQARFLASRASGDPS